MLFNNQWINEKIRGNQINLEKNDNENMAHKTYGMQQSSSKMEVYSNSILPQETWKISNKQPKLMTKATQERRTNKTQS